MSDVVVQELSLDISKFEAGADKTIERWEQIETQGKQFANLNPFKKQADDLLKFNNQLQNGSQLFGKIAQGPKTVKGQIGQLSAEYVKLITTQDKVSKSGDWKKTEGEIGNVKKKVADMNSALSEAPAKTNSVKTAFGQLGSAIKGAFTATGILLVIDKVVEFGKKLIDVTSIGEGYQNQFTRIFEGNASAAQGYLSSLQNVADTTNFTFDTLTDNAAKLASRGIIPTKTELLGLGDAANFIKKDFGQLNEAILDANNSERWKELGFTVKTEGDKMTLAYGDFSIKVDSTVKGAYSAIQAFSKLGKVQGSTAEAGETLGGRISTLGDNFDGLFRTIGQGNQGVLSGVIDLLSRVVQGATNLYKTLQPALDGVTSVFGKLLSAMGGIFTAFGNFQTGAEKSATVSQKFGYYINKYLINPLVGITLIVSGVIESFNLIVLGAQLAAAKLGGKTSLANAISIQVEEVKERLNELRSQGQQLRSEFGGGLEDYTKRDNQRKRREDRRNRLNEEETENFKPSSTGKPAAEEKIDKKKLQHDQDLANKLISNREKLNEELKKVADKFADEELDQLDKNSQKYIDRKRQLDLKELEDTRKGLIKMGQELTGHEVVNARTGVKTWVNNKNYQLPKETQALFNQREQAINSTADRDAGRLAEEEFEKERLNRTRKFRDAETQFDKDQATKREKLQRDLNDNDLALQKSLNDETDKLVRSAGESEIDFEKRKSEALLQIKLDYYEKALKLAEADPSLDPKAVQNLRTTIQGIKSELKTVQDQAKTGPQNLFQLLGLTFKDKDGKDITSQVEKQASEASALAIETANNVLNDQISVEQARIDSYDRLIEAKANEIQTEATLSAAGLANSLTQKRQEQAALEAERKKALEQQQTYQKIQLGINATLQASELALAIAKLFNINAGIPFIGVLSASIQAIALFASFASTIAKISSLPKYHDGDEVTLQTARTRSLSSDRRPNEVDARLQVGEGVIRKKSYQSNKRLLQFINQLERPIAEDEFTRYMRGSTSGMDEEVKQRDLQLMNRYVEFTHSTNPDPELHRKMDQFIEGMDQLIKLNKPSKESVERMPDGRIRRVDAAGNVRISSE